MNVDKYRSRTTRAKLVRMTLVEPVVAFLQVRMFQVAHSRVAPPRLSTTDRWLALRSVPERGPHREGPHLHATAANDAAPGVLVFRKIYDTWFTDVVRWVRALGASVADQDDVVQEVFIVVHRRLPYFDGNNLGGWLYRIAAHQVRDFRRLSWIRQIFSRSVPLSSNFPGTGPTPLRDALDEEKRRLTAQLLSGLNESQRAAFVLFEMHGYTGEEIAQLQGVSINTVRARILRARKKLIALLLKWRPEATDALEIGEAPIAKSGRVKGASPA